MGLAWLFRLAWRMGKVQLRDEARCIEPFPLYIYPPLLLRIIPQKLVSYSKTLFDIMSLGFHVAIFSL